MLRKVQFRRGEHGFTLIELMIVIAIIGILAAIAIPNFIAYRNKAFCSQAESDANNIASALSDYFAIPSNTSLPNVNWTATFVTGGNSATVTATDVSVNITITVTDGSGRCPADYQAAASNAWDGANVFTKIMNLK